MILDFVEDQSLCVRYLFPVLLELIDILGYCYHIFHIGFQAMFVQQEGHPSLLDDKVGGSLQPILLSKPSCGHL